MRWHEPPQSARCSSHGCPRSAGAGRHPVSQKRCLLLPSRCWRRKNGHVYDSQQWWNATAAPTVSGLRLGGSHTFGQAFAASAGFSSAARTTTRPRETGALDAVEAVSLARLHEKSQPLCVKAACRSPEVHSYESKSMRRRAVRCPGRIEASAVRITDGGIPNHGLITSATTKGQQLVPARTCIVSTEVSQPRGENLRAGGPSAGGHVGTGAPSACPPLHAARHRTPTGPLPREVPRRLPGARLALALPSGGDNQAPIAEHIYLPKLNRGCQPIVATPGTALLRSSLAGTAWPRAAAGAFRIAVVAFFLSGPLTAASRDPV